MTSSNALLNPGQHWHLTAEERTIHVLNLVKGNTLALLEIAKELDGRADRT
jgi:hypothetical protein